MFCEDGVPFIKPVKQKKEGQGHGNDDMDKNQENLVTIFMHEQFIFETCLVFRQDTMRW